MLVRTTSPFKTWECSNIGLIESWFAGRESVINGLGDHGEKRTRQRDHAGACIHRNVRNDVAQGFGKPVRPPPKIVVQEYTDGKYRAYFRHLKHEGKKSTCRHESPAEDAGRAL